MKKKCQSTHSIIKHYLSQCVDNLYKDSLSHPWIRQLYIYIYIYIYQTHLLKSRWQRLSTKDITDKSCDIFFSATLSSLPFKGCISWIWIHWCSSHQIQWNGNFISLLFHANPMILIPQSPLFILRLPLSDNKLFFETYI